MLQKQLINHKRTDDVMINKRGKEPGFHSPLQVATSPEMTKIIRHPVDKNREENSTSLTNEKKMIVCNI